MDKKEKNGCLSMNEPIGRCFGDGDPLYERYHDTEWGIPSYDDRYLFEMLCLEGAQAGLSWITILRRREGYKEVFHNFQPHKCAHMSDDELESCIQNTKIIRNRKKVYSVRQNANVFQAIQKEYGSFSTYLWGFVEKQPIRHSWTAVQDVPCESELSRTISKDLKKRGMSFVGPTIIYSYLQAVGVIWDHLKSCKKYISSSFYY